MMLSLDGDLQLPRLAIKAVVIAIVVNVLFINISFGELFFVTSVFAVLFFIGFIGSMLPLSSSGYGRR